MIVFGKYIQQIHVEPGPYYFTVYRSYGDAPTPPVSPTVLQLTTLSSTAYRAGP